MSAIEEVKNKFSKYIDGKPINGLKVDWKKINKDFKKMESDCKTPSGLYDPCMLPFDSVYWFTLMSERTSSKTTQLLLYAMILYKNYGVKFCYVRRNKDNITKSMYTKLFEVINDKTYNYIGWLTNNQFNSVIVTTTKDVYFSVDGNPKETSAEPIGVLMDVEEYDRYCSSFNTTVHDFIIFDEFCWGGYRNNEFVNFCQLVATIRRMRKSVRIVMLSNTINPYNQYLQELGISTQLAKMHKGQKAIITSELGTRVYCEMLDVQIHQTKEFNTTALEYFGFANESLRALYGGEWEIQGFKHLPHSDTRELEKTPFILDYLGYTMRVCTFVDGVEFGFFIERFTGVYKDDYIKVSLQPLYNNEKLEFMCVPLLNNLTIANRKKTVYISDNETGIAFNNMLEEFKKV